jgi:hypothetical protein
MNAKPLAGLLAVLLLPVAQAATVLEYERQGRCQTDFDRMAFDGLYARVDNTNGGGDMSTIFDDGEQMMYLLMHDSRQTMTMESDDDAVDFQSDVGRSTMLYSGNQTEKLTGMDQNAMLAQAQAAMTAACPELADLGFSDPDYADAAARCSQKMGGQTGYPMDARMQKDMLARLQGKKVKPRPAPAQPPVRWSTTQTVRDGERKSVAGVECTVETMRRGDTVLREQCMAPVEALALDARAMRRLQRIVKVGQGMSAGIASLHPEANPDAGEPAKVALERVCYQGGQRTGTATLRIDREASVPASQFEIPAGYEPLSITPPGMGD